MHVKASDKKRKNNIFILGTTVDILYCFPFVPVFRIPVQRNSSVYQNNNYGKHMYPYNYVEKKCFKYRKATNTKPSLVHRLLKIICFKM